MATSSEILEFLDLLDKMGMDFNGLCDFVHDEALRKGGALSDFCHLEYAEDTKLARILLKDLVKSRQGSLSISADELIQKLSSLVKDEHLDETLTRLELQKVTGMVARWKKLRAIPVVQLPTSEKVTAYLRQATNCYLYGLPSAAAVLCRAVLEFALEEKFGEFGGISKLIDKVDKEGHLKKLINFAGRTKILSDELLVTKAHSIREVGRDAIHKGTCTERQALETIKKMGEILSHLYGRSGSRAR